MKSDPRHLLIAGLVGFVLCIPITLGIKGCADRPDVPPKPPTPIVHPDIPVAIEGVRVLFLYDKEGDNDKHNDVLYGGDMEAYLNAVCAKDGDHPEWRRWDDTQDVSGESAEWQAIYKAGLGKWDGKRPTAFVVRKQTLSPVVLSDEVSVAVDQLKAMIGE